MVTGWLTSSKLLEGLNLLVALKGMGIEREITKRIGKLRYPSHRDLIYFGQGYGWIMGGYVVGV